MAGRTNILKDISAGIVVALVSIPISMGYAQIAGLPAVYGLYGSLLPIVVFALFSSSPQFIVGVDAMPAALIGGLLAEMGIMGEAPEAMRLIPVISLLVAVWFVIFRLIRAGRIVKYISSPVMSGFISGVGATIILMQVPKLFGGSAGTGEVFVLLDNIVDELPNFNILACCLGVGTVVIILVFKKIMPKVPMTVIMLFVGAATEIVFHVGDKGVKLLPQVASGLPKLIVPDVTILMEEEMAMHIPAIALQSLSIAAVIMAQSLLATGSYASKNGYKVDNNKELVAYSAMNVSGAFVGSCAINGSVSRTAIADSFGMRSKIGSFAAGLTMLFVLLFGTPYLRYLPVPILTGIVLTALIGIIDFKMMKRLWKDCRNEWVIFMLSFVGVLVFGTVYGVIIGCILSFWEVAIRAVAPPVTFVGRIPGMGNFHSLSRNKMAKPVKNTVIYRFSGNLFFANIDKFVNDIEGALKKDTYQVIVDARGIGNIDISALDKVIALNKSLRERGIKFYITEHDGSLNDQIRKLGGEDLIKSGAVRRTITLALRDAGVEKPYALEGLNDNTDNAEILETDEKLSEFEWAFGEYAEEYMDQLADSAAEEMLQEIQKGSNNFETIEAHGAVTKWGMLGLFDENEFFDHLEAKIEELHRKGRILKEDARWLEERIEERKAKGEKRLSELNPHAMQLLHEHRIKMLDTLKKNDPEEYEHLMKIYDRMRKNKTEHDDTSR